MIKGKTKSGFSFSIPESRLNSLALLQTLRKIVPGKDTYDPYAVLDLPRLILGEEQEQKLYDHIAKIDPEIPWNLVDQEVTEILNYSKEGKNSSPSPT